MSMAKGVLTHYLWKNIKERVDFFTMKVKVVAAYYLRPL